MSPTPASPHGKYPSKSAAATSVVDPSSLPQKSCLLATAANRKYKSTHKVLWRIQLQYLPWYCIPNNQGSHQLKRKTLSKNEGATADLWSDQSNKNYIVFEISIWKHKLKIRRFIHDMLALKDFYFIFAFTLIFKYRTKSIMNVNVWYCICQKQNLFLIPSVIY